jgi:hypothetical protein
MAQTYETPAGIPGMESVDVEIIDAATTNILVKHERRTRPVVLDRAGC